MRSYLKVLAATFVLVQFSCSGDLNNRQINVAEEIEFEMLPVLSPFHNGLNFSFQSDSIYHCQNVGYLYTLDTTAVEIKIHLLGVYIPDSCVSGDAPAFEKVAVHNEEGYYAISLDIGDYIHNTGTLVIEPTVYEVYLSSRDGMSMPHNRMFKIPEGSVWGYVVPQDPNQQAEVMNTVKHGLDSIADPLTMHEGYYGYFSITKPFGIFTEFPVYHTTQSCFIYHFSQDHTILENAIDSIRTQLPDGTEFKVFTWEGLEL